MSTHYKGTIEETQALDTFIKLTRAVNTVLERIEASDTVKHINTTQFGVLETLYHLGELNQTTIGEKLLVSKSNVVAVLDKLQEMGYLTRRRCTEDRRVIWVNLTDAGRKLVEELLPGHVLAIKNSLQTLNMEEQQQLSRLCRKLGRGENTA